MGRRDKRRRRKRKIERCKNVKIDQKFYELSKKIEYIDGKKKKKHSA